MADLAHLAILALCPPLAVLSGIITEEVFRFIVSLLAPPPFHPDDETQPGPDYLYSETGFWGRK